ncbi:hypothetical protein VIAE109791_08960 [Vibrio aestuarianus subsp. francensis]
MNFQHSIAFGLWKSVYFLPQKRVANGCKHVMSVSYSSGFAVMHGKTRRVARDL